MGVCMSVEESTGQIRCGPAVRASRKEKKRLALEVLGAEAKAAEVLEQVPGRMHANGASAAACLFTQQGQKGRNQDAMIVWENFASRTDTTFCGVFDGHGSYGHLVAKRVRDSLPSKVMAVWKARQVSDGLVAESGFEEEDWKEMSAGEGLGDGKMPESLHAWRSSFLKAYHLMDKELRNHPKIDCLCSGTTAVTMLLQERDLVIGNLGDSRAVLGTRREDKSIEAIQLTVDLKPTLPREAERIKRSRGRVFALEDEPEVARVFLPHHDSPGLAMARAFGDFCLKDFGVIAVPELSYRRIRDEDMFIVLASDGIWDVVSNEEAVEVIWRAETKAGAARALVEKAGAAWRKRCPTLKMDDCAVVCFYLNHNNNYNNNVSAAATLGDMSMINTNKRNETCSGGDEERSTLQRLITANSLLHLPSFFTKHEKINTANAFICNP